MIRTTRSQMNRRSRSSRQAQTKSMTLRTSGVTMPCADTSDRKRAYMSFLSDPTTTKRWDTSPGADECVLFRANASSPA